MPNKFCCFYFQQLKHIDFNILTIIQSALCVAPSLFVYCYFGKLATESYANIANELYSADWPNLPVKLQKHVLLMITNAQQSHFYDGFGVAILNLQTFMSVSQSNTKTWRNLWFFNSTYFSWCAQFTARTQLLKQWPSKLALWLQRKQKITSFLFR